MRNTVGLDNSNQFIDAGTTMYSTECIRAKLLFSRLHTIILALLSSESVAKRAHTRIARTTVPNP